jgi:ABC-2 type transport system ATP-binding protein
MLPEGRFGFLGSSIGRFAAGHRCRQVGIVMHAPVIELCRLTKTYRVKRRRGASLAARLSDLVAPKSEAVIAVDEVSFSIAKGERVAFIGPNGAGKSTTLKLLSGILHPDSGQARVLGKVPWTEQKRLAFELGTVFGQRSQLWYHLPARDTFELLAKVYEIEPARHRRRLALLVEAFELAPLLDKAVSQLSLGERMRAEIAASLLHEPKILFLDEPTIGLDVSAKATIRALLRERSDREAATLLLTSHDTGDMERVCERVIVIHRGRVLWDGSLGKLRQGFLRTKRITLWSECESLRLALPGVRVVAQSPHRTELELDLGAIAVGAVVDAALRQAALRDLTIEDPPLDEVIRALYAEADRRTPP